MSSNGGAAGHSFGGMGHWKRRSSVHNSTALKEDMDDGHVRKANPVLTSKAASAVAIEWAHQRASEEAAADLHPDAPVETSPPRVSLLALLSFSTRKERRRMFFGLIAATVSGLSMPFWLLLLSASLNTFNNLGKLINEVGTERAVEILQDQLMNLVYSFLALGVVALFAGSIYVSLWTLTGERQALRIRQAFVSSAFQQDAKWFDTRGGDPQELPTLAANALNRINTAIGRGMADTYANLLSSVFCLVVAVGLNWSLALIIIAFLPFVGLTIGIVSIFVRQSSGEALKSYASAGALATEVISGIKTVASLSLESWAIKRYQDTVTEGQKWSIRGGFLTGVSSGVTGFLFYTAYVIAFIYGSYQVAETGDTENSLPSPFYCMFQYCGISGGEVLVCIYGIILSCQFFTMMAPGIQAINHGRQAAVDVFDTIKRKPDIDASSDKGTKLEKLQGHIEFQNVTFAYPTRPLDPIFMNLNLDIKAGSSIALTGPSGSGKSSITKLLLRFYDPNRGSILVDGVPLDELNLRWWRSQIGYVPQEPSLLIGTIRDNIAAGMHDGDKPPTDEQVVAAAKAASADEFIRNLPEGYSTMYSGASIQLSGGQIQRIAIARALIASPAILLLDEATSALDSESEKYVQDALAHIRETMKLTTVTVAHRLSTIMDSDQILVIANGGIEESGTHASLLKQGGVYATLCYAQGIDEDTTTEQAASESGAPKYGDNVSAMKPSGDPEDIEAGISKKDGTEEALVEKYGDDEDAPEETAKMSRLMQYNKPERKYILLGVGGAVTTGALKPCEGILYAMITANFFNLQPDDMRRENRFLSLMFFVLAGVALFGNLALACGMSVAGYRLTRRMRVLVFERIVRHSMGWFDYPQHSTGELTARLEEDAEAVSMITGWALGYQIQVISAVITGVTIALAFSWRIGLIAIGCVPFILFASFVETRCTRKAKYVEKGVTSSTILEQGLREISLIQAYNLQEDMANKYSKALEPLAKNKVKEGLVAGFVFGFSSFATYTTFAILFYAGLEFMIAQRVTFTEFFVSLLAVMFAALTVAQGNADFNSRRKGLTAAARIFAVVDEPYDSIDPLSEEGSRPSTLEGTVDFESCGFSYPTRPGHPIFYPSDGRDGLSLSVPSKHSVGFVGRSGCGKSTALQLLLRFYDVSSGQVAVDGNNVKEVNIRWLRSNIGYVGQQPVLFAGTVRENILLGKPDATPEEIENAATAANAHGFIKDLPDGYDTDIGAGGSLLSGGQKQRVAIARAIIKNPPIIVLDEATSALDPKSESVVQCALDEMQKTQPRTTLVVAHRLTTVENCDSIAVLDGGGVKEHGTHADLLKQKGLYHKLWKTQGKID